MGLTERLLRRIASRPRKTPDYERINRLEHGLDAERRAEELAARQLAARETCEREGHLDPVDGTVEITTWGSAVPLRTIAGCPRCGSPVVDVATNT